jgi:hypothetical protein
VATSGGQPALPVEVVHGDQRGAGNHMKPDTVLRATRLIKTGEVFELGRVLSESMPMPAGRRFEIMTKRTRLAKQDPMLVGADNGAVETSPNPNPQLAGPVHQIMLGPRTKDQERT